MQRDDRLLMTPGPTEVEEPVRRALGRPTTNPDLDPDFYRFYDELGQKLGRIMGTRRPVLVLTGEGMLGLDAAVASLVEPDEPVLVLSNGLFGRGFGDLVERYGARPVYVEAPFDQVLAPEKVEEALAANPRVRVATLVHCETPTGLLNPVEGLLRVLGEHQVISIVDAVSSLAADPVETDAWGADVVLGASQKALSAPTGLALVSVSDRAWEKVGRRKTRIPAFYANLLEWKRTWLDARDRFFPYTPAAAEMAALGAACDALLAEGLEAAFARHRRLSRAVRVALRGAGFRVYAPEEHAASSVTAFLVPEGVDDRAFRRRMWEEQGVMMAGSLAELEGRLWRVGHMGAGAREDRLFRFMRALEARCRADAVPLAGSPAELFLEALRKEEAA
ncbi:pyridoxal-phosphate-dependent aminotransferase family protein [Limnochorda pilosa]|uniref:Aminotransferase class V domain-containing protein n=1 Tax=Limnochorda pilosa TaxID=1555112 RepID=A0A0K2SQL2_LIMPI|nr:alanine--glyoxylate aminotransferase family protein [Limnochorda pilosa]BAS29415.1 hypothetical protein LIP_3607 [Limnochorda pilosa]